MDSSRDREYVLVLAGGLVNRDKSKHFNGEKNGRSAHLKDLPFQTQLNRIVIYRTSTASLPLFTHHGRKKNEQNH